MTHVAHKSVNFDLTNIIVKSEEGYALTFDDDSIADVIRYATAIKFIPPKHKNDAITRLNRHKMSNSSFFLTFF